MKRLTTIAVLAAALASGFASFLYARNPGTGTPDPVRPPMAHLLELSDEQERAVTDADPSFLDDATELAATLDSEQEKLAALLDNPDSGREETLAQVETMMSAHNSLERRVAGHILAVREHLPPEQRKKLMGLMAGKVRTTQTRMRRCRWGWPRGDGGGRGPSSQGNGGPGRGRGGRKQAGQGRGLGRRGAGGDDRPGQGRAPAGPPSGAN